MAKLKYLDCEAVKDALTDALHGSGFDGDWSVELGAPRGKNTRLFAEIGYHAMDEHGGYDGWFDVCATLNAVTGELLNVQFRADKYHRRKYLWERCYFEDCMYEAVAGMRRALQYDYPAVLASMYA